MPIYRHECRNEDCELVWDEEYSLEVYDAYKAAGENVACPSCSGRDTFRHVTDSGAVIFQPGGVGWADNGYYQYGAYDKYKSTGIKVYDRKEDHDREVGALAEKAELRRLKAEDRAAKRAFGPDAGVKQSEADRRIKKARLARVKGK